MRQFPRDEQLARASTDAAYDAACTCMGDFR